MDLVLKGSEGQSVTNSFLVAQKFGKRHANVLRAIRDLQSKIDKLPENERKRNFYFVPQLVEQPNGGWREEEYCAMDRDGFVLLTMGFTGENALRFKLEFIAAFNRMEAELRGHSMDLRKEGGDLRTEMGDFRKEVEDFRKEMGNLRTEMKDSIPRFQDSKIPRFRDLDVREDESAHRFFDGYLIDSERGVYLDKIEVAEYYASACVLNAIANLLKKTYGVRGRSKKYNQVIFWSQATALVSRVNVDLFPHALPTHAHRLRAKYMNYLKNGYASLVHRGMGNQNAKR
jgi:Rha family phage regulatory protein